MAVWKPIKTEGEYKKALLRIDELIDAQRTDDVRNELMLISIFVERYEVDKFPIPDATPVEIIQFIMDMKDIKQKELIPILGSKGQVSRILNVSRNLTSHKIVGLSSFLGIPAGLLLPVERQDAKRHRA